MGLMVRSILKIFSFMILICILLVKGAVAEFIGPNVIISEQLGIGRKEIGIDGEDPYDDFAKVIKINDKGTIFVADKVNKRVKVYNQKGVLKSTISPKDIEVNYYWPQLMESDSENNIYAYSYKNILQKYTVNGELAWSNKISAKSIRIVDKMIVITSMEKTPNTKFYSYDLTGQLIWIKEDRPKILGEFNTSRVSHNKYQTKVSFPDITYKISGSFTNFYLGCRNELYANTIKSITKFNDFGNLIGGVTIPQDERKVIRPGGKGLEEYSEIVTKYGQPVFSPLGNIYTWKRSQSTYQIIKWFWVDGLDSPQFLTTNNSKSVILLNWQAPTQNLEGVEGYEIVRSTDVCGPFKSIESVAKGILQFEDKTVENDTTYYYQVRAIKKDGYSGFSNKAVGIRK